MPAKIIDFTAPHKRKTESEIEISKVEKMALDKKMSYGQYVAMIEEAQRSAFLQEYEQKKAETARGCVTRFTMPLVQAGQGEPFKHCLCSAFLLFETLNTELRSRWQMLRSAAGG